MTYDVSERSSMMALAIGAVVGFVLLWASRLRRTAGVPGWSAMTGRSRARTAPPDAGLDQM